MATNDEDQLKAPAADPAAPRIARRPASAGTTLGNALRVGAAAGATATQRMAESRLQQAQAAAGALTGPNRAAAGFIRDAGRAAVGMAPSPNQGQPVAVPGLANPLGGLADRARSTLGMLRPPRFGGAPKPAAAAGAAAAPLRRPTPVADFSGVTSSVDTSAGSGGAPPSPPAAAPAVRSPGAPDTAPPTGAATYRTSAGRSAVLPAGITRTLDANGNPVFTGTGAGVAAGGTNLQQPSNAAAPGAAPALATPAPILAPRPTPQIAQRGRQGAIIENPGDSTVDKLVRAMGSSSLKGSPSGRAAVAQAILGEAGARQAERAQTLRLQDDVDLAAGQANAVAAQGNATRDMQTSQFNAQMQDSAANRQASMETARLARRPEVSVAADGGMGIIGADGSWRPVTGADGQAMRAAQAPRQTGELTDADRLKSYTDRFNSISGNVGLSQEEKKAALGELDADPLYRGLRPQEAPPVAGARKAPDGNWYVQHQDGSYSKVTP